MPIRRARESRLTGSVDSKYTYGYIINLHNSLAVENIEDQFEIFRRNKKETARSAGSHQLMVSQVVVVVLGTMNMLLASLSLLFCCPVLEAINPKKKNVERVTA